MKHKIHFLAGIFVATFLLNGCSTLSSAKKDYIDSISKDSTVRDYMEQSKADEALANLNTHIDEWHSIAPEIKKVIELAQELEYVLNSIDQEEMIETSPSTKLSSSFKANNTGPMFDNEIPSDGNKQDLLSPLNKFKVGNTGKDTEQFNSKQTSENVLLEAAPPLLADENKFSKSGRVSNVFDSDNKQIQSQLEQDIIQTSSESNTKINCEIDGNKLNNALVDTTSYAIHVASYTRKPNLKQGLASLKSKYQNKLCGKSAIFKPVTVNGKSFYSLRFGPFDNQDEAKVVCSSFAINNEYCSVTRFEGQQVL